MDLKLGFCVFLSLNLLILLVDYGTEARKMVEGNSESLFISQDNHQQALKEIYGYSEYAEDVNHQQEISDFGNPWRSTYSRGVEDNDEQVKRENEHIHSSFFFLMDDLKIGKTRTLSFQKRKKLISSPSANSLRYFFPKEAADSIPFSTKELPNVLQRFSLSKNSPQVKSMEHTLRACEDSPIKGETKYCATSAEALLDYVQGIMGEKTQFEALSTTISTYFSKDSLRPQNYTILYAPEEVAAPKMVACHVLPYAQTAVFYCHNTVSKVKVFKVSLGYEASGGDRVVVEAIAVCHLDTSEWNPSHESLRTLGILPGTSPVCHFFTSSNDLLWLPKPIIASTGSALKHPSS